MEQNWDLLFAHPAVQSVAVPLGMAILVTGLLRLRGMRLGAPRGAGVGIGLAFVISAWLIAGGPLSGAFSAVDKLLLLTITGLLVGTVLELFAVSSSTLRVFATALFLCAGLWIAWPQLERAAVDWPVAILALGCAALVYGLARPADRVAEHGVSLLLAAAGTGGVALVSGSLLIAQLAIAMAVANLGFLIWNWPRSRDTLGPSVLLGATVPLLVLVLMTVLLTRAPAWALAPMAAVFFLGGLARRVPAPGTRWREAARPLYVLILGCIPIAIAIFLALLVESPDDAYYQ